MTIKQQGGVFGRNPTFNDANVNEITIDGLRIYFDGTRYMIASPSTEFRIQTSDFRMVNSTNNEVGLKVVENGAATLYWDGASRLVTADAGVQITGNVIMANGKGIDFSATSGTGTSELFDDYEEGTWTPVVSSTSGTITSYTVNSARYTKIGRLVSLSCQVPITNNGTGAGALFIQGFPFTNAVATCGVIYNQSTGHVGSVTVSTSATNGYAAKYDGSYPVATGQTIQFSLTYGV